MPSAWKLRIEAALATTIGPGTASAQDYPFAFSSASTAVLLFGCASTVMALLFLVVRFGLFISEFPDQNRAKALRSAFLSAAASLGFCVVVIWGLGLVVHGADNSWVTLGCTAVLPFAFYRFNGVLNQMKMNRFIASPDDEATDETPEDAKL